MDKKGFTLIELLAVIVILAIIAIITAPIVVGIIANSRESANTVSASNYIKAVNDSITKAAIDNIIIKNGYYEITKDGNICLDELDNGRCDGKEIKISVTGKRPVNGMLAIKDDFVSTATVIFEDFSVEIDYDGKVEYKPFSLKYSIGQELSISLGDSEILNFYVIDEDEETITLLSKGIVGDEAWITEAQHNKYIKTNETCGTSNRCMYLGPINIFEILNGNLAGLNDLIIKNYEYVNNPTNNPREYQKITIKNGITTITDYQGNKNIIEGKAIARLLSAEEFLKLASRYNENYTYEKLKKTVVENQKKICNVFNNNCTTLDEILEIYSLEDNWLNMYYLATIVISEYFNNVDEEVLSKYSIPDWLGDDSGTYWTSSTHLFSGSSNSIYIISSGDLPSGNKFTFMLLASNATKANGIKPVIQINKNSERIQ